MVLDRAALARRLARVRVLVTGAAAGLGRALVEHAIERGARVVAVDRDAAGLAELEYLYPTQLTSRRVDLADAAAVEALTKELARGFRFDMAILNAGVSATGRFEALPAEAYARLVAVNVVAPLVMARGLVAAEAMERQGTLVFISSLSHAVGYPGAAVYAASKDAVAAYARAVRRPWLRRRVRVATVFPGPLRTEHAARHAPAAADAAKRMSPDVAARAIWRAVRKGKREIYPGVAAKGAAAAGRWAPGTMTRMMRRAVFERLDGEVW